MSARRTTRRSAPRGGDRERAILDATEALLREVALQDLSVAQVLERAGVARATFYQYFDSKYDAVAAVLREVFGAIYAETRAGLEGPWSAPEDTLRAALGAAVATWGEHRAVIHAVVEHQAAEPVLAEAWAEVVRPFHAVLASHAGDDVATLLVCCAERVFYVGAAGLDPALADPAAQVDAIVAVASAALSAAAAPVPPRAAPVAVTPTEEPGGKRQDLVEALARLLAQRPLGELSVADVLAEAGSSRASFYFHFESLDDAASSLVVDRAELRLREVEARGPGASLADVLGWVEAGESDRALVQAVLVEWPRRPALRAPVVDLGARITRILTPSMSSAAVAAAAWWTLERTWSGGHHDGPVAALVWATLAELSSAAVASG